MGAVSDIVNMGDWSRMRMWLLAIGVAILGSAALHASGQIDLSKSIYRTPTFTWLSYIVGGLSFGIGMVLASGCGSKTLIRIGAGNLKSVVVFIVLGSGRLHDHARGAWRFPRQCTGESGDHLTRRTGYSQPADGRRDGSENGLQPRCFADRRWLDRFLPAQARFLDTGQPARWCRNRIWPLLLHGMSAAISVTWQNTRRLWKKPSSPPIAGAWNR
jgi:hypothetical protein